MLKIIRVDYTWHIKKINGHQNTGIFVKVKFQHTHILSITKTTNAKIKYPNRCQ